MSEYRDKLFSPAKLNGLELRNRVIRAATFEGMCPRGYPSDRLIDLHRQVAEGGVAMTTVAYCAVEADGRVKEEMMYMHEGIRPQIEQLTRAVHEAGAKISGQMVHCGNFSQNRSLRGKRPLGPSWTINSSGIAFGLPFAGAMTHADIERVVQCFHNAAVFMKSAGFDALEIHFGHGYGLSQFISPKTNRRTDEYGGSLINRMRYPLRALEAVRKAVGESVKLKVDANSGYTPPRAIEVGRMLEQHGVSHYEEPCPYWELEWTAEVAAALSVPVAGGEQDNDLAQWRRMIRMDAVDVVQPDLCYVGGFTRALRVARMAEKTGKTVVPHSANLSLVTVFAMHLMAAIPNAGPHFEHTIEWSDAINAEARALYQPQIEVKAGRVAIPEAPGWGVVIDPSWLASATRQVTERS